MPSGDELGGAIEVEGLPPALDFFPVFMLAVHMPIGGRRAPLFATYCTNHSAQALSEFGAPVSD
jgi:hypothetical protein